MHPKIAGSPDIIIREKKIAVFLHGCFWHGCKKCYRPPKSNKTFWKTKVQNNIKRDLKNEKLLRRNGWKIIRIWEHEIDPRTIKNLNSTHLKSKLFKQ